MRVADVGKINGVVGAVDGQLLTDVLVGLFGAIDGDVVHREAYVAHVYGDRAGAVADFAGDDAAECIDSECVVCDLADVV